MTLNVRAEGSARAAEGVVYISNMFPRSHRPKAGGRRATCIYYSSLHTLTIFEPLGAAEGRAPSLIRNQSSSV